MLSRANLLELNRLALHKRDHLRTIFVTRDLFRILPPDAGPTARLPGAPIPSIPRAGTVIIEVRVRPEKLFEIY